MTPVVWALTKDGRELPPGYWISKRDLALLVTAAEVEGETAAVLEPVEVQSVGEGPDSGVFIGLGSGAVAGFLLGLVLMSLR